LAKAGGAGRQPRLHAGRRLGPQAGLFLAREASGGTGLSFAGGLTLGVSRGSTEALRMDQLELGAWAGVGVAGALDRVWTGAHVGVGALGVLQRAVSHEAERRRSIDLSASRLRAGAGAAVFAALSAELPISARTGLFARLGGHVALVREDAQLRLQPVPTLLLGSTWGS
ncbi:caspase family protein, partial [Pyxidicoccus sp. 3LG]